MPVRAIEVGREAGPPRLPLAALVWANLAASALHFADNVVHYARYPEPRWISSGHVVDALWFAITPLLLAGAWCRARRFLAPGWLLLATYGVLSFSALGHYLYGPPSAMSLWMNVLILLEAAAALALLVAVARDAASSRARQRHQPSRGVSIPPTPPASEEDP